MKKERKKTDTERQRKTATDKRTNHRKKERKLESQKERKKERKEKRKAWCKEYGQWDVCHVRCVFGNVTAMRSVLFVKLCILST